MRFPNLTKEEDRGGGIMYIAATKVMSAVPHGLGGIYYHLKWGEGGIRGSGGCTADTTVFLRPATRHRVWVGFPIKKGESGGRREIGRLHSCYYGGAKNKANLKGGSQVC